MEEGGRDLIGSRSNVDPPRVAPDAREFPREAAAFAIAVLSKIKNYLQLEPTLFSRRGTYLLIIIIAYSSTFTQSQFIWTKREKLH